MARARSIKPGFFRDLDLCSLPPLARLLFAGLWTIADRDGRLKDQPKQIKVDVLPFDKVDIEQLLSRLDAARFIIRYNIGQERYIQIRTWKKHQNPHIKEPASSIPEQIQNSSSTVLEPGETGTSPASSLTPLTFNPEPCNGTPVPIKNPLAIDELFHKLWTAYPPKRRTNQREAMDLWLARIGPLPPEDQLKETLAAVTAVTVGGKCAESKEWKDGMICGIVKFIDNMRWHEDWGEQERIEAARKAEEIHASKSEIEEERKPKHTYEELMRRSIANANQY